MPIVVVQRRARPTLFIQRRSAAAQRRPYAPLLSILTILVGCASPSVGDRSLDEVTEAPPYPTAISAADAQRRVTSRSPITKSTTASRPATPAKQAPANEPKATEVAATPLPAAPPQTDAAPRPLHAPQAPIPLTDRDRLRIATPRTPEPTPPVQLFNVTPSDEAPAERTAETTSTPPQPAAPAPAATQPPIANPLLPMSAMQRPITQTALAIAPQLTATVQPAALPLPTLPAMVQPAMQSQPTAMLPSAALPAQLLPGANSGNASFGPAQQLASQVAAASANIAALNTEPVVAPAAATEPISAPVPDAAAEAPATINDQLAQLIASLQTQLAARREAKAPAAEIARLELQLRILYVVAERPTDAAEAIEALSPPERESIKHLLFGLSSWMTEETAGRAPHRNAKIARSLRDATSELAAGSRLDLRNMTFCEKVEYFGWYTEFPKAEFTAKQQVILYVEVENFAAEQKGPQAFETELQGSYQIFDASNALVAERSLPLDRETCRNLRRDYFLAYRIYMPDQIAAGAYRLELTLEDVKARGDFQGRKLGQATIDFSIR